MPDPDPHVYPHTGGSLETRSTEVSVVVKGTSSNVGHRDDVNPTHRAGPFPWSRVVGFVDVWDFRESDPTTPFVSGTVDRLKPRYGEDGEVS